MADRQATPSSDADLHRLVDRQRLIERTVELIRLPSVNPFGGPMSEINGERAVVDWLADHLDRLGFDPVVAEAAPGRPNIVGIGPGGGGSGDDGTGRNGTVLALAGHTDTVGIAGCDDPFGATVSNGRIHGRGACDMKGALACFIEVAEVLARRREPLTGRLMIIGLADEEHEMIGSRMMGSGGPPADQIIIGEPTELLVCTAHKGQLAFPIRTTGRAVHSSLAHQGVNAIDHMMEIVELLGRYRDDLAAAEPHPLCGLATVNAGVIHGGEIASMVPDRCELEVDRRILPGETSAAVLAEIRSRIEQLATGRPSFEWEVGPPIIDAAPLDTDRDQPIVAAAARAVTGRSDPGSWSPQAFSGATDAPNLGAPAVIWGPGSLAQAHTIDEWVAIDQLVTATHLYLDTALDLLR